MGLNYPTPTYGVIPRYVAANNGQGICSRVDLSGLRKINSFTIPLGYCQKGYLGGGATGTGVGRNIRGAIWLNKPSGYMTYPDYVSTNVFNTGSGPMLTERNKSNWKGLEATFSFDNVVVDRNSVWMGIVSTTWETKNNFSDVAFNACHNGSWEGRFIDYDINYKWNDMWGSEACMAFTKMNVQEPYKTPTIDISSKNVISNFDDNTSFDISANNSGDPSNTYVSVIVNNMSESISIGNNSGSYSFKPIDKGVGDSSKYNAYATRVHDKNGSFRKTSNTLDLYTYRVPKIAVSLSNTDFSGIGNTELIWDTNAKRWDKLEQDFKTEFKFKDQNKWININNAPTSASSDNSLKRQKLYLDRAFIRNNLPISDQLKDRCDTNISVKRTNMSSKKYATAIINCSIQFKPKYNLSSIKYIDNDTGKEIYQGDIIYKDIIKKIKVSWSYPNYKDKGVIDGYKLEVYTDKNYTDKFKEFNISTNDLQSSYIFDSSKDLKRGVLNYLIITPYYKKPDNTICYGLQNKYSFVKPIGRLEKPVILFPMNHSIWINDEFRILLKGPADSDYNTYDSNIKNEYRYKSIKISINDQIFTFNDNKIIFSNNELKYMSNICINPSAYTFNKNKEYKIKIAYQKNYYEQNWSEWSDTINLTIDPINELSFEKGQLIKAEHFNSVQSFIKRSYNAYPIEKLKYELKSVSSKIDHINQKDYQYLYDTIKSIYNGVNNWTTYDNIKCKFERVINKLDGDNKITTDIVTTNKDERPTILGRNYINILIDQLNNLI